MSHSLTRTPAFSENTAARMAQSMHETLGFSQEELARATGVSVSTAAAWVSGKRVPRAIASERIRTAYTAAISRAWSSKESAKAICAALHVEYGSPRLGNLYDPLDELFFILCSLKTSFLTYEATFDALAGRFRPWRKLLVATPEAVAETIRKGGFGSLKAKAFVDIAHRLKKDFGKVTLEPLRKMAVEKAEEYLRSLPGVGVKTARCVLLYAFGADVVPVDTHTYRVGVRLGLVPTSRNPDEVHRLMKTATPHGLAYMLHVNFVAHGRAVCKDLRPLCDKCVLQEHCPTGKQKLPKAADVPRVSPYTVPVGRPTAIDLYAGCGGLSLGLRDAGFNLAYALDWEPHACQTHEANFPETLVECRDVRTVSGDHILSAAGGRIDLVAGGPNCQGVSQRGLRSPDDPRNFMFPEFLRIVEQCAPRTFLMENVPGLAHRHNFGLLREIFSSFERLGYRCAADVLLAADYGVPQLRYRFAMIGTLGDEPLGFPSPTHFPNESVSLFARPFVTIRDAISDLPPIESGYTNSAPLKYLGAARSEYQQLMRIGSSKVYDHQCSATDAVNLERASHVPEGGNWKDIPPGLLPNRFFECRLTDHSTTYARPRWNAPGFTVTALLGNITAGAFTHPSQNRAFSIREGARLQSFPDTFLFRGPASSKYRQIGNAVPPLLARAIGTHLLALLKGERPASKAPRITRAVLDDDRAWGALPVLTPRFKMLFGKGTRWPKGWGEMPENRETVLDQNYKLRRELRPVEEAA